MSTPRVKNIKATIPSPGEAVQAGSTVVAGPFRKMRQANVRPVEWDGSRYVLSLRGVEMKAVPNRPNDGVDIFFEPPELYGVCIREVSDASWGPTIVLPYDRPSFVGLDPDKEYQVRIEHLDREGNPISDLDPSIETFRPGRLSR